MPAAWSGELSEPWPCRSWLGLASPQTRSPVSQIFIHNRMDAGLNTLVSGRSSRTEAPLSPGGTSFLLHCSPPTPPPSSAHHLLLPSIPLLPSLHHSEGQALATGGRTRSFPPSPRDFGGGQRAQQGEAKQRIKVW